jgi:transposase-like protein
MKWRWYSISQDLKSKILKAIEEEWKAVYEVAEEYKVNPKTVYNWLNKSTDDNWSKNNNLWEIRRLKKDKDDLLLIIWELTAELNKTKKKK